MANWNNMNNVPEDEEVILLDSDGAVRTGIVFAIISGRPVIKSELDFGDAHSTVYWPKDLTATGWLPMPKPANDNRCPHTIDLFEGAAV